MRVTSRWIYRWFFFLLFFFSFFFSFRQSIDYHIGGLFCEFFTRVLYILLIHCTGYGVISWREAGRQL